jgi:hypothetical protein
MATIIEQMRVPYEQYNRAMIKIMGELSKIQLFSGYTDSDGNKICQGDTVRYIIHSDSSTHVGTVMYGEYEDSECYMTCTHCGWYIKDEDPNIFTSTLPDAVQDGITIIGGKMIARG